MVFVFFVAPLTPSVAGADEAAKLAFFESKVRPVLVEHCQSCHGPKKQQSSFRVDSLESLLKGGDIGTSIVPGKPGESLLIQVLGANHDLKMPPKGPLPAPLVKDLETWVRDGAVWPKESAKITGGPMLAAEAKSKHWAYQAVKKTEPPILGDPLLTSWNAPIDRFLLDAMLKANLRPAPEADRRTLLRRASFDLIGLPPTPEEIEAFEKDKAPDAWEKQIDRLLASPRYGERWARHWLDLARYADTKGYVFNEERRYPFSWTYRDYAIRSMNEDKPYDRFLLEQLAADLVDVGPDKTPLAALGYLTLGRRFLNNINDIIDDRIDTVMRGLQGMTLACARCHDHKYDALTQKDYYALYGIFSCSTEPAELPLIGPAKNAEAYKAFEKGLAERQAKLDTFLAKTKAELPDRARKEASHYLLAVRDSERPPSEKGLPPQSTFTTQKPMLERWKTYLGKADRAKDPVWKAWFDLAALPTEKFAELSPAVIRTLGMLDAKAVHPTIREALLAEPQIKTLSQVATAYGKAFDKAIAAKPDDPNFAALRKVLFDADSPCTVPTEKIERFFTRADRNELSGLKAKIDAYNAGSPGAPPRAMALEEKPKPNDHRVFLRGNPGMPGPSVKRRFPEVLYTSEVKTFEKGGGRLELAQAIASPTNPLTARVFVNRVWMLHFGEGLVRTPGDFGVRGELPTHPELLDYLAATFVENGWSIKKLHKQILTSRAWRQSSDGSADSLARDPENRLLAHANRRRFEFEIQRDAMLFVAGKLKLEHEGPSVDLLTAPYPLKRTIYGFIDRQNLPGLYRTFDTASPDLATPKRHNTTVPQQALFWMNHPFTLELAQALASRKEVKAAADVEGRIKVLYRILFGRNPDASELSLGLEFLQTPSDFVGPPAPSEVLPLEQYAQALLCANEFVFVD